MKSLANFALFQLVWLAAVGGAAQGWMWSGPLALLAMLVVHLALVEDRRRELVFVLVAGLSGGLLDSALRAGGAIEYPTSGEFEPTWLAPPWIFSLWLAFALLPRFSLAWLSGRTKLAVALGAIGGPLSFWSGTHFGVIAPGDLPLLTWAALSLEYAIVTPLLLACSPRPRVFQAAA